MVIQQAASTLGQQDHVSVPASKRILITQSLPAHKSSRYQDVARRHGLQIDFHSFLQVKAIPVTEFRLFKPKIILATAFIFTSKIAIDHFFAFAKACSIKLSTEVKFFCTTELLANYLQHHVMLRKRKIFFGHGNMEDFLKLLKKHKPGSSDRISPS